MAVLVTTLWKNQTLKSIDSFTICANCKLRKIFTLKICPSIEYGVLCLDDQLNSVNFPEETNSVIQMFELPDGNNRKEMTPMPNLNSLSEQDQQFLTSSRPKTHNVFKIAFGSKIPQTPSSAHAGQPLKSAKVLQPAETNVHLAEASLARKSSDSNIFTKSASLSNRDDHLYQQISHTPSNEIKKTSWNQRASAKTPSTKTNVTISNLETSLSLKDLSSRIQQNQQNNLVIQSNKIPHPPPQSTRPTSTSARKLRLSSVVKNNQQAKIVNQQQADSSNEEDMQNSSKTLIEYSPFKNKPSQKLDQSPNINTKISIRNNIIESDFNIEKKHKNSNQLSSSINMNEDIIDLIQALKSEQQKPKRPPLSQKSINLKQSTETIDIPDKTKNIIENGLTHNISNTNNNVNYSFSSRPKAAPFLNANSQLEKNLGSSKVYDYRKYTSPNDRELNESTNVCLKLNENLKPNIEKRKDSAEVIKVPWTKETIVMDSLNNSNNLNAAYQPQQPVFEVMDSFEANMLLELKAEMEANTSNQTNKNSSKKGGGSHLKNRNDSGMGTDSNGTVKTRDQSGDSPILARDNSGIQSPLSDDYNQTTSEKYNFDAITSSIDETTASVSKKTVLI